jgi:helicase MOV-10
MIFKDKAPKVTVGDFLMVRHSEADEREKWHHGCVHEVPSNLSYIRVRFSDDFNTYNKDKFDIRFVLNRLPLRRAHFALRERLQERLLFPTEAHLLLKQHPSRIDKQAIITKLNNKQITKDPEQLDAITSIVRAPPGSPPFLIFGPYVFAEVF